MRLDGTVLSSFMPDWLTSAWQQDLPQLAGKVKLMPSPAWEKGGRRTTVMGGTMLGISKRMKDVDSAWRYANPREFPWLQCYVMPALIIAALWMSTGFNMIYFLAALMVLVPKTGG
jgi:ABC-type sugar transport system permease subunit